MVALQTAEEVRCPSVMACPDSADIVEDGWGSVVDPETGAPRVVRRYTLRSACGLTIQLVSYGAAVVRVRAPDKRGVLHDVLLCPETLHDYIKHQGLVSSAVRGRVANRIDRGRFMLDGVPVFVSRNDGGHCLHGGFRGFDKVLWQSRVVDGRVVMTHLSGAGDEGFPGALLVVLVFRLTTDGILVVEVQARADRPTPVDLRHGLFLNLAGHDTGEKGLLEHTLTVNAAKYFAPMGDNQPSEHMLDSRGTLFDFLEPHPLKDRLHMIPRGGYDHTFYVNVYPPGELSFAARLEHAPSGRAVEVYSDQLTLHVNTGRYLPEAEWQYERALPMPRPDHKPQCDSGELPWPWPQGFSRHRKSTLHTEKAPQQDEPSPAPTPPSVKSSSSSVWSAATCSVILSSSSGSSCDWPIAKPRNRWDKATSTTSLARAVEAATSTHMSLRDRATSITPLRPQTSVDIFGGGDTYRPETPPDPDVVEAERRQQLLERWNQEDRDWRDEESVCPEQKLPQRGIPGRNGVLYYQNGGIELSTQGFPDAVNRDEFPSCILKPGEVYKRTTVYFFSNLPKTEDDFKEDRAKERAAAEIQREMEEDKLKAEEQLTLNQVLEEIPEEPEE